MSIWKLPCPPSGKLLTVFFLKRRGKYIGFDDPIFAFNFAGESVTFGDNFDSGTTFGPVEINFIEGQTVDVVCVRPPNSSSSSYAINVVSAVCSLMGQLPPPLSQDSQSALSLSRLHLLQVGSLQQVHLDKQTKKQRQRWINTKDRHQNIL